MLANNHFVEDGRFITDADVLHSTEVTVIGNDIVTALFPRRDAIGRRIEIGGRKYTVVGIFERKGSAFDGSNDNFVMIPFSSFDRQFPYVAKARRRSHPHRHHPQAARSGSGARPRRARRSCARAAGSSPTSRTTSRSSRRRS